ncbi:hypothetical protein HNY73_009015 [Argiope bruennichi]|uniref:Uncharacterized protein n=1 Tax=Argiope bruennichi TaxID=94029 RepID=A0A8T0F874_ARGBR|nr:hypothetical protein HNY73_009015 [Argiope bruennichi]
MKKLLDKINNAFDGIPYLPSTLRFPMSVLCYYTGIFIPFLHCIVAEFPLCIMDWFFSAVLAFNCFFVGTYFFMRRRKDLAKENANRDRMFEFDA